MTQERTWSVSAVARAISRVVDERMSTTMWIRGEVTGLRERYGRLYFDLVDTDDDGRVMARLGVYAEPGKARLVERRMALAGQPFSDEVEVRIRGRLGYRASTSRMSLTLVDIDPAHTAGRLALQRRELLRSLAREGLLEANARAPLPRLPLRLGLITSPDSQAYHDVVDELRASGLPFDVRLVPSMVQGPRAPGALVDALTALARAEVDVTLLARGGGAEADLLAFDDETLSRAIAGHGRQVWTGIGHHLDTPVAEAVAARRFKTPTALAQGVVATVVEAVADTERCWDALSRRATGLFADAHRRLDLARSRLGRAHGSLRLVSSRLELASAQLQRSAHAALDGTARRLERAQALVDAHDPATLLARGWSLTHDADGRLVDGPRPPGTRLLTTTRGGTIASVVTADDPERT